MNRRSFLRLFLASAVSETINVEKLLWIPGTKTIFLPTKFKILTESQIVAMEIERLGPKIKSLFERDSVFCKILENRKVPVISSREMRIPLIIEPGK